MQRTFVQKRVPTEYNTLKYRSSSVDVKSPTQILELIKLKRSNISRTNVTQTLCEQQYKPLRLVLPKIHSITSPDPSFSLSRLSSRNIISKSLRTKQSQKQLISEQSECNEEEIQGEVELRCTHQINQIIKNFSRIRRGKNLEEILPLAQFLKQYNPFFKNLAITMIISFLKTCKIRDVEKGRWIYKRNDHLSSLFIILWGKMKIINIEKSFKKISIKGETLSEQIIFNEYRDNSTRNEGAKSLTHSYLLQIPYATYLKVYKQLVLKGYKNEFRTMETLIRRNYILKQGLKYEKSQR